MWRPQLLRRRVRLSHRGDVPQYKRDFQQKLRKFREHHYMRVIPVRHAYSQRRAFRSKNNADADDFALRAPWPFRRVHIRPSLCRGTTSLSGRMTR